MSAAQFKLELDAEWAATVDDIAEAVAGIGLEALTRIVRKTPVDTGRAKGNWVTSIGVVEASFDENAYDKAGAAAINEGATKLSGYPDEMPPIYIQNNLPYINRLENGWSGQAPQGMVGLTMVELEAMLAGGKDV